ncbi:hypothetical protein MED121_01925 [Marinomonas sp. MED121]|uniref:hypothetical protein n=1 Tax=Marinomonas sp. MED121 TaxID=314277 RepID=UPI0000690B06|nr:hypothetical protein [Marinomonas sp. MED121]EAQ65930.1 hypothetical protein MED121_01925 [Marinomonas sp. MED121]
MRHYLISLSTCALIFLSQSAQAANNVAIAEFVNNIRGSFNMLVAKEFVPGSKRLKKTRKMIKKGYNNEIRNMNILLSGLDLVANIRAANPKQLPQFAFQEQEVGKTLDTVVVSLTSIIKTRIDASNQLVSNQEAPQLSESLPIEDAFDEDDIGSDIDLDDNLIEISDESIEIDNQRLNLDDVAKQAYIDIALQYVPQFAGKEVTWYAGDKTEKIQLGKGMSLKHVFVPYQRQGLIKPYPLHSIFATSFMPDRKGVLHVMRMYIILMVNEAEHGTVRVATREIPTFRWDRNPYFIAAATGTVLKKIFTSTLGQKVDSF